MATAAQLRKLLQGGRTIAAPGAADALTARLVERAGFAAVYMTGLGATAARLGMPDLGLMTGSEMADHARSLTRAVDIPVIADADTGYGGALNIRRTVEDYARAGVAALHLEDQVSPKRCGQLSGVRLVEADQAEARLRAAVAARAGADIVLIGRTDALAAEGMEAALERARRYAGTGVDLLFVDGIREVRQVEAVARAVPGPKVVSLVDGTEAARLTLDELQEMGFSLALYAVTALFSATMAAARALSHLRDNGTPAGLAGQMSYAEFSEVVGLAGHQDFAHGFGE